MTFYTGQKVTLKWDLTWIPNQPMPQRLPVYGEVYTVDRCFLADEHLALWLCEFLEIMPGYKYPQPYEASVFRPVVETKTDISIFTKMLSPAPVDA